MIYAFLGLLLLSIIGTGAGYYKGRTDGVDIYKAKAEAAQVKVDAQAKQLVDEAVQHQADVVAAFDKGRADVQEKTKIVYVKGAQYAANDKALSSPQCVMAPDSLQLLNSARADLSAASAAVASLGLSPDPTPTRPSTPTAVHPKPQPVIK